MLDVMERSAVKVLKRRGFPTVAPPPDGDVVAIAQRGGLHHRYERRAA